MEGQCKATKKRSGRPRSARRAACLKRLENGWVRAETAGKRLGAAGGSHWRSAAARSHSGRRVRIGQESGCQHFESHRTVPALCGRETRNAPETPRRRFCSCPRSPQCTAGCSLAAAATQRDGTQADQTGWRHLFGAALDLLGALCEGKRNARRCREGGGGAAGGGG